MGSYLVVQDTKLDRMYASDGAGTIPRWHGPTAAVRAFLQAQAQAASHADGLHQAGRQFEVDRTREKLLYSQHPSGYLKRVR